MSLLTGSYAQFDPARIITRYTTLKTCNLLCCMHIDKELLLPWRLIQMQFIFASTLFIHNLQFHRPCIEMCLPTSLDPTLAPEGCHVASLFTQYTTYRPKDFPGGWTDEKKTEYVNQGKY